MLATVLYIMSQQNTTEERERFNLFPTEKSQFTGKTEETLGEPLRINTYVHYEKLERFHSEVIDGFPGAQYD